MEIEGLLQLVGDVDEPVVIRVRHEPHPAAQRLLVALGAGWVVDAGADPCVRYCGRPECRVTDRREQRIISAGAFTQTATGFPAWEAEPDRLASFARRRDEARRG